MIQFLSIINCLLNVFYAYYAGTIIFKKRPSIKKIWYAFILYVMGFYITLYFFSPLFSIFFKYFLFFLFYKLAFKKSFFQALAGSLIAYTIRVLYEVIFIFFNGDINNSVYVGTKYNMVKFSLNVLVFACSFISAYLFKGLIAKIDKRFSEIKPLAINYNIKDPMGIINSQKEMLGYSVNMERLEEDTIRSFGR